MLYRANTLTGFTLQSLDGDIGRVKEFYFDDVHWTVRYLVADTGGWLSGKQVLISPHALGPVLKENRHITVNLTRKQIEACPPLSADKPVSRVYEEAYYGYYGWPVYWEGPYMWGAYPYLARELAEEQVSDQQEHKTWDPHLRSSYNVTGYHLQAADGVIGHLSDFILDDETWAIRYMVADTRNWWPGKKVLVSPHWVDRVSWVDAKVFVNLNRQTIRLSPEYSEEGLLTRDYEAELHRHYNRQGYWDNTATSNEEGGA